MHIPRKSELVAVNAKSSSFDIKPLIERALDADEVIAAIEPFKANGSAQSPTGNARIDDIRAMDLIVAFDAANGGGIKASNLKDNDILQAVNVVLRRRYELNKKHKIVGVNPKRYTLLAAPTTE
jgi:hypothetical protein